ncbi:hypothetical protein C1I98_14945 [Spongiactinospora gelatinilytica]|uniref:Uncharacterized protein n=1 Tax=Spongiactinospora gelatinilytica TaxID=2666298 RepID=A0A2W2GD80_9ACTN|nr:hypothetical protein [Spongiactinospora gelatinilytica]PZG45993.1 hypothetical protein C1I98_14945 [Spongiactinospora gelatinilytica]
MTRPPDELDPPDDDLDQFDDDMQQPEEECGCGGSSGQAGIDVAAAADPDDPNPPGREPTRFQDSACITFNGTGHGDDPITAVPVINPAPCNALRCTETGLLVPRVRLQPLPSTAPGPVHPTGARSIDIEIRQVADNDCPDRWQIGARLSPVAGQQRLVNDRALHGNPGRWLFTGLAVTLPQPGRYYVSWDVNGNICAIAGHCSNMWVSARVVNAEGALEAPRRGVVSHQFSVVGGTRLQTCQSATAPITHLATVTPAQGTKTLRLQAIFRNATRPADCPNTTVQYARIRGDATFVTWHKISD